MPEYLLMFRLVVLTKNFIVNAISAVNIIFTVFFFMAYFFQYFHAIVSLFSRKKVWPEAKVNHKYGIIICGRNEEIVIGNLLSSIEAQDYPKELIQVFVCADNCTDNTAKICKEHGAFVYERHNLDLIGKSYAQDELIRMILNDEKYNDIECFIVMDADNLVSKTFVKEMNKTFDQGYDVSTSFRESKNFDTNWISGTSSIMFYRECTTIHRSRQVINVGTYVSGTGYFVSRRLLERFNGWPFHTMIEDIEFSAWCAIQGIKITFNEDAVFYDEQPSSLMVSNKQRIRWCKGMNQIVEKYSKDLIKGWFKSKEKIACFELFFHNFPLPLISTIWFLTYLGINALFYGLGIESKEYFIKLVIPLIGGFIFGIFILAWYQAIFGLVRDRKRVKASLWKKIFYVFMFPFYAALFIPISLISLYKDKVVWEHIDHVQNVSIDDFQTN